MIPNEKKLLDLLSSKNFTFFIPPYQRNYEWDIEQCSVFLDDIVKTSKSNLSGVYTEHFFGSITYFSKNAAFGQPSSLVLIDGQQRITTAMLFLTAVRDILQENGQSAVCETINSDYLKNEKVRGDDEFKIKLKQVETDWNVFKNLILSIPVTDEDRKTPIWKNYEYFIGAIKKEASSAEEMIHLVQEGLALFSVITIELVPERNPWENPQEIFESMNSLGKPLSLADLVRNYILLGLDADTQTDLYNQYWMRIEKTLPGKVSNFIRDYMQAIEQAPLEKASEANYKKLYSSFKRLFGGSDAKELLTDLVTSAELYACCLGIRSTNSLRIDDFLKDLNRMSVTTAYSFLMVLLDRWKKGDLSEQDTVDVLYVFRIYCLRRRLLRVTTAENRIFPTYAGWLDDIIASNDKRMCMFEKLSHQESNLRLPNDIEVRRYLTSMNFSNFGYCKFYLALIEEAMTKNRPDISDQLLQLEHIMPQTPSEEWKRILGPNWQAIHQELVGSLGNLTLIRHNQELGNKPFEAKKAVYEGSEGLQIARAHITDRKEWNEAAIRSRTDWLVDYMLENIFPIPEAMREVNNFRVKTSRRLSLRRLGLIGESIYFNDDPSYAAVVKTDSEVEFEGRKWRLSPLTHEIQKRRGKLNKSGAYQGAAWWSFNGQKLIDMEPVDTDSDEDTNFETDEE